MTIRVFIEWNILAAIAIALFCCLLCMPSLMAEGILITDIDPSCTPDPKADRTEQLINVFASNQAIGRVVVMAAGDYHITGPIVKMVPNSPGVSGTRFALKGEKDFTRIVLDNDCVDPIFVLNSISRTSFSGVDFHGNDHTATWFSINNVAHVTFEGCRWGNTRGGPAIVGRKFWDSSFLNCRLDNLDAGIELLSPPADMNPNDSVANNCNNIVLDKATSCELIKRFAFKAGAYSRKNRLIGCKIERCGDKNNPAVDTDPKEKNIVLGCQFTKCDKPTRVPLNELIMSANIIDPPNSIK